MLALAEDRPELLVLFDGSNYGPAPIGEDEQAQTERSLPEWLRAAFAPQLDAADIASLSGRAPLDLRVNSMHVSREAVLEQFEDAAPGAHSDRAIRLETHPDLERHPAWREGLIDIQDEVSQLIADACGAKAGRTIVDLCAGAGGKTLALYDRIGGEGRIVACDTDRNRLSKLAPRAERCRMPGIETRLLDPRREAEALADLRGAADIVLVDAPCSGTGTWRRNPEARWRLTEERVARFVAVQKHILGVAADLVSPGGILVYAVCSLLAREGEEQISAFLASHSAFSKEAPDRVVGLPAGEGFLLTPARHGTDGFFFARLVRSC
jgi:16S rRNA (cytosine967-C5)-methyltransferase